MSTGRRAILAIAVVGVLAVGVGVALREPILARWDSASHNNTLVLSGNIEAHESVLSFNSVQSRIVQLPFNEGQWVTKGTLVAAAIRFQTERSVGTQNRRLRDVDHLLAKVGAGGMLKVNGIVDAVAGTICANIARRYRARR